MWPHKCVWSLLFMSCYLIPKLVNFNQSIWKIWIFCIFALLNVVSHALIVLKIKSCAESVAWPSLQTCLEQNWLTSVLWWCKPLWGRASVHSWIVAAQWKIWLSPLLCISPWTCSYIISTSCRRWDALGYFTAFPPSTFSNSTLYFVLLYPNGTDQVLHLILHETLYIM